jgi:hypothetical protein
MASARVFPNHPAELSPAGTTWEYGTCRSPHARVHIGQVRLSIVLQGTDGWWRRMSGPVLWECSHSHDTRSEAASCGERKAMARAAVVAALAGQ